MPVWLEALLETLGKFFFIPKFDDIRNWLVQHPLANAIISCIPLFGPVISYGMALDQLKFLGIIFIDIWMFVLLFLYPFYKIFTAYDVYQLTKRKKAGKKLGNLEFFWN